MKLKDACSLEEICDQPRQHIKRQRHYFADKGLSSQSYSFSNIHVWIWDLDHKEGWVLKNWCFQTVALEKTLESPLDCKELKPVNTKGNQPWKDGRTDAETETPILWTPDAKGQLIRKDPDVGEDWGQREKRVIEVEIIGWHQWIWVWAKSVKDREARCAAVHGKELDTT